MNEKELSLFRLLSVTDIGAIRFFRLPDRFGEDAILKAPKRDLMSVESIYSAITVTFLALRIPIKLYKNSKLHKKIF